VCRTISAVANDDEALARVSAARKLAREAVWAAGGEPPAVAAASAHEADGGVGGGDVGEPLAIDLDATISIAHSDDKDGAGATYKGTWGFHPMLAYLDRGDGTSEALAGRLRAGNAGANNAGDRLAVFAEACWQLPELPAGLWRLVRADTAGASHAFLDAARQAGWAFSVGFPLSPEIKDAIRDLPEAAWTPAITQCGDLRPDAEVAELTDTVDLAGWPAGSRLIVRCEPLHPGAQQTLDYVEGCRFTAFLTDQPDQGLARLDARHRGHARVEDCIRCDKDTGLRTLPCDTLARNAVWLELILSAHDLINLTQVLALDGELRLAEPQQLRYKLLHLPANLPRHARKRWLHLKGDWPWSPALVAAFQRLRQRPSPGCHCPPADRALLPAAPIPASTRIPTPASAQPVSKTSPASPMSPHPSGILAYGSESRPGAASQDPQHPPTTPHRTSTCNTSTCNIGVRSPRLSPERR
jgi:hypothetical protein